MCHRSCRQNDNMAWTVQEKQKRKKDRSLSKTSIRTATCYAAGIQGCNPMLLRITWERVPKQVAYETSSLCYARQMPGEIILGKIIRPRIPKGAPGISK